MYLNTSEYDKITVLSDPKEIIYALGNIPRPGDEDVTIDNDTWYKINEAIKLIMDSYGIHYNYDKHILMYDDQTFIKDKYWWLDKFTVKYDSNIKQLITQ